MRILDILDGNFRWNQLLVTKMDMLVTKMDMLVHVLCYMCVYIYHLLCNPKIV